MCCLCNKNDRKLKRLYDTGAEKLDKDFSIDRIVKHLKSVKALTKHSLTDEILKF